jgi:2-keto-3-deoxy-L-rhamnonate aldolase RhmA
MTTTRRGARRQDARRRFPHADPRHDRDAQGRREHGAILAVPGIDAGHLGQFDLSLSLGIPGRFERKEIQSAIDGLTATAKKHGKTAACMAPTLDTALEWQKRGFRMISYSYDTGLMQDGLRRGIDALRKPAAGARRKR